MWDWQKEILSTPMVQETKANMGFKAPPSLLKTVHAYLPENGRSLVSNQSCKSTNILNPNQVKLINATLMVAAGLS